MDEVTRPIRAEAVRGYIAIQTTRPIPISHWIVLLGLLGWNGRHPLTPGLGKGGSSAGAGPCA